MTAVGAHATQRRIFVEATPCMNFTRTQSDKGTAGKKVIGVPSGRHLACTCIHVHAVVSPSTSPVSDQNQSMVGVICVSHMARVVHHDDATGSGT